MPVESLINHAKFTTENDLLTKNVMAVYKIKPTITQSTFFLFPLQS